MTTDELMSAHLAELRARDGNIWDAEYRPLTDRENGLLGELMVQFEKCVPKELTGRLVIGVHWAHNPQSIISIPNRVVVDA